MCQVVAYCNCVYARLQRIKRPNGQVDEYVQILESYREGGKVRQKVIANLGNKQILKNQLPSLLKILKPSLFRDAASIEPATALPYGVIFVVHHLFNYLSIIPILKTPLPSLLKILTPSLFGDAPSTEPATALPYGVIFVVHQLFKYLSMI